MKEKSLLDDMLYQEMAKIMGERYGLVSITKEMIPVDLEPELRGVIERLTEPPFSNCENGFKIIEEHWLDPTKWFGADPEKRIPAKLNILAGGSDEVREEVDEAVRILNEAGFRTMVHFVEGHVCTVALGEYTYWRLSGIKKLVDPHFDPRTQDRRFFT